MSDPKAFTCIYCLRSHPEVTPSEAHIFTHALGGSTATKDTVCTTCNISINREIEMPVLQNFAFFRSIWGIRGRKDSPVRVRALVTFAGKTHKLALNERGEADLIIWKQKDATGSMTYKIFGPAEKIEAKLGEITKKYPQLKWQELDTKNIEPPESLVEFDLDLRAQHLRRLAAKVAFERFAQLRGSCFVADNEFTVIRNFVLTGSEHNVCSSFLADPRLLKGSLNFPPPLHAVVIIAHPYDTVLGAFVSFFSLFYYWVILSTNHTALGPMDDLLIENPQSRECSTPLLRGGIGSIRVPWNDLVSEHLNDPRSNLKLAAAYAVKKFNGVADKFYIK